MNNFQCGKIEVHVPHVFVMISLFSGNTEIVMKMNYTKTKETSLEGSINFLKYQNYFTRLQDARFHQCLVQVPLPISWCAALTNFFLHIS